MQTSTSHERDRRMGLAPESATIRGLIFNAVFKLVARHRGEAAATALRASVAPRSMVDFFAYPARDFIQVLYRASELLASEYGSPEAALRACGAASIGGFFQSSVGKTLVSLIGYKDPKRLLASTPTAYSTAVNYGKREYSALGERRARLHFKGDMQPVEYHQGLLMEALKVIGVEGRVEVHKVGLDEADYVIEW